MRFFKSSYYKPLKNEPDIVLVEIVSGNISDGIKFFRDNPSKKYCAIIESENTYIIIKYKNEFRIKCI
jgi:hypothetical protein